MYPIITIGSQQISMTWLGRIVGLAVFLIAVYHICPKKNLQFRKIFYWLPIPIISSYLLGSYVSFFLTRGQFFPFTRQEFGIILSPFNFEFHYVGILLGIILAIYIFFRDIHSKKEQYKRIETLSQAVAWSLIPLWVFLVLGDHFIGVPSMRWWETFRGDISRRSTLGKVAPIGIMISITGLVSWLIYALLKQRNKDINRGYILFCMLLVGIAITLIFQHSPKYWVLKIGPIVFDIKTYVSFLTIMVCLQQFFLQFKYKRS